MNMTLSIVEGDAGPDAEGDDLAETSISYGDFDEETRIWLERHGFDTEHTDRWVLVTQGTDDPKAVNVIASREVVIHE